MENIKLDTKGMDCPLPLIELKKALGDAEEGQIIEVEFTCPDAVVNLPGYCEEHNHEVLDFDKQDNNRGSSPSRSNIRGTRNESKI